MERRVQHSTDPTWELVKNFDESCFTPDQEYKDKIFGWYCGTYIALLKEE